MPMASLKKERTTLTAADWEREALEMIGERGVGALAVEPLARRMGITKGSFYWHLPTGSPCSSRHCFVGRVTIRATLIPHLVILQNRANV